GAPGAGACPRTRGLRRASTGPPRTRGRRWRPRCRLPRLLRGGAADELARATARVLVVVDGDLAVHQHRAVALPGAVEAGRAARQVVAHTERRHRERIEVDDAHVGREPGCELAAP